MPGQHAGTFSEVTSLPGLRAGTGSTGKGASSLHCGHSVSSSSGLFWDGPSGCHRSLCSLDIMTCSDICARGWTGRKRRWTARAVTRRRWRRRRAGLRSACAGVKRLLWRRRRRRWFAYGKISGMVKTKTTKHRAAYANKNNYRAFSLLPLDFISRHRICDSPFYAAGGCLAAISISISWPSVSTLAPPAAWHLLV